MKVLVEAGLGGCLAPVTDKRGREWAVEPINPPSAPADYRRAWIAEVVESLPAARRIRVRLGREGLRLFSSSWRKVAERFPEAIVIQDEGRGEVVVFGPRPAEVCRALDQVLEAEAAAHRALVLGLLEPYGLKEVTTGLRDRWDYFGQGILSDGRRVAIETFGYPPYAANIIIEGYPGVAFRCEQGQPARYKRVGDGPTNGLPEPLPGPAGCEDEVSAASRLAAEIREARERASRVDWEGLFASPDHRD